MKNWEDILRNRLSSYQELGAPGQEEALWNAIESQIAPTASGTEGGSSNSIGSWGRWGIAAAAAVVLTMGLIHYTGGDQQDAEAVPKMAEITSVSEIKEVAFSSSIATSTGEQITVEVQSLSLSTPAVASAVPAASVNSKVQTQTQSSSPALNESRLASTPTEQKTENPAPSNVDATSSSETEAGAARSISTPGYTATAENAHEFANEAVQITSELLASLPLIPSTDQTEESITKEKGDGSFADATDIGNKKVDALDWSPQAAPLIFLPKLNKEPMQPLSELALNLQQENQQIQIRMPLALRAYAVLNLSQFAFGDDRDPELNTYFQANIGAGGGLTVEFQKWSQSFAVGMAWNEFIQHLDYVEHTEYAVITEGIQTIQINEVTGDTMAVITGDVEGIEQQARYVSHYNRYRAFAIPLEWQQQQYFGPWQLGIGLGALIQFRSYAEGRTIGTDGLVADYSEGNLSQTRVNWMPTGRLFAGFFIAPEWRADLSISSGLQPFNNNANGETQLDGAPAWQGRLVNGQVQIGVTRFFAARFQSE